MARPRAMSTVTRDIVQKLWNLCNVLRDAGIDKAAQVVVAVDADDAAVLVTLTAREHNETATIVAAVREDENAHLLHQSGATAIVRTS